MEAKGRWEILQTAEGFALTFPKRDSVELWSKDRKSCLRQKGFSNRPRSGVRALQKLLRFKDDILGRVLRKSHARGVTMEMVQD